jgi:thiosulfate reductase cytochrome b subunit
VNIRNPQHRIYRHPLPVRLTHWIAALALGVLAMSGMQIFNAHPALYASDASVFNHPVMEIGAAQTPNSAPFGFIQVGSLRVNTGHVLGYGPDGMGGEAARAFPPWATIPAYRDLSSGRRWHFFFAWVLIVCALVYAYWALRLRPTGRDIRELPHAIREHLVPWKVPQQAALNPLQKVSYFGIVFVIVPLVILSGLALSPAVDAWAPWLPALFGGRQFARLWHFVGMIALIGFFAVHITMVALTGLWNNLRSMITGWFVAKGQSQ